MKFNLLSQAVQDVLAAEEISSAKLINRVRYIFIALISGPVIYMGIETDELFGTLANTLGLVVYLVVTGYHTKILREGNVSLIRKYNFVVVFFDIMVIFGNMLFWEFYASTGDFVFTAKSPSWVYIPLMLSATLFQYDKRVTLFGLVIFLVFYAVIAISVSTSGVEGTTDWLQYVQGGKVVWVDVLLTKPLIFIMISLVIVYTIKTSLSLVEKIGSVESQRARLSRYFSPSVVAEITSNPEEIESAKRQKATILFLDIRGFTALSERLDSETLVAWLSDFRKRLTSIVFNNNGSVDKFIGDAILATFGTPHPSEVAGEDSTNAVKAALEMLAEIKNLNQDWSNDNIDTKIGIGIHTGEVFAGNIGDSDQIEYTVIGDPVNTASRIEGLCKKLERTLIVSKEVADEVRQHFELEALPRVKVKGKEEPLVLFSVKGAV